MAAMDDRPPPSRRKANPRRAASAGPRRGTAVCLLDLLDLQRLVRTAGERPVPRRRGRTAAPVRHAVSVVRAGSRLAPGILFREAA